MNRRWQTQVICLTLLLALYVTAPAQQQAGKYAEVFSPVEAALRSHLADRLKTFVEYERTQQWDKLYELTYKPDIGNETEEFVKRQRFFAAGKGVSLTLDFIPETTLTSP